MLRNFFLVFSISLIFLNAHAQQAKQYTFSHYTTVNGLASNAINNIKQDQEGFIWIATNNGLQRYDGNRFLTFKKGSSTNLPDDYITGLYIDRQRNLWVLCANNQVGIFDTKSFRFEHKPYPKPVSQNHTVKYFLETPEGDLYLHDLFRDIYRYDPKLQSFTLANDFFPTPKNWRLKNIVWDSQSKRYWAASDSGFVVYNPLNKKVSYNGHNEENIKAIEDVGKLAGSSFAFDQNGSMTFTTWGNQEPLIIHSYNRKTGLHRTYDLSKQGGYYYHEISGFHMRKDRVWIYGNPVLTEWNQNEDKFYPVPIEYKNEQSIKFDYLNYMYEDKDQNLWLCTDNGLYFFNPQAQNFNVYNLVRFETKKSTEAAVTSILETNDRIWVGCWALGVYTYDKNFTPIGLPKALQKIADSRSIWDMEEHKPSGDIWMVMQAGELLVYHKNREKLTYLIPSIFEKRTIRQVVQDKAGNLWFGTQRGKVIKWNYRPGNKNIEAGFQHIFTTGLVRKILVDKEGYLWIGTEGLGLHKLDPKTNQIIKSIYHEKGPVNQRLSADIIHDIIQYNDSTLALITGTLDLINTKTYTIEKISKEDGLPSKSIYSGSVDKKGIFWLGTVDGLCRANLKQKVFTLFNRSDGIIYDNFFQSRGFRLSDNRVAFGMSHNFIVFDPEKVVRTEVPTPKLTSIWSGTSAFLIDSLQKNGALVLPHYKNSIQLTFSSLNYLQKKKLQYYFKLENLDKTWIKANEINQATYNYLPPGEYVFKVRTENADGISSPEYNSMPIIIRPPFWKTWWFISAVILAIIGLLMLLDRERMRRLQSMQKMRSQIAGNLHEEINTTLNNINILSEMAKMKAEKDVLRSKEYIEQISEKSASMIISMDDMLWSISPENDTMQKMILRLHEFADALRNRYAAVINLAVDKKLNDLNLEMNVRHEYFLILKLAFRLFVEDCYGRHINISIDYVRSKIVVKMRDEKALIHAGRPVISNKINEMNKRSQTIGAELDIQTDGKGLSVIIILPV